MYAVIESGGKQHRVKAGDVIKLEKLAGEPGATIEFDKILLQSDGKEVKIGTPYIEGAKVSGEVVKHDRHKKINILKFKRRKNYMKQQGHRQDYTEVKITKVD
jgi:large subunit ribosomal protein L21